MSASHSSDLPAALREDTSLGEPLLLKHHKLQTVFELITSVRNWPEALALRMWRSRRRLRLLEFRNGLNVVLRGGTNEWSVVHELLLAGGYAEVLQWLSERPEPEPFVIDLGGNIGLFSLLAARSHPGAKVVAFEPGPPNQRMFRLNMLANPQWSERVELREQAVAGNSGRAVWNFDADNPGGSSLQPQTGELPPNRFTVQALAFSECVAQAPKPITLVKMDIEGAEWDVLAKTPAACWTNIEAVALELHDDPSGQHSRSYFIREMKVLGFRVETGTVCSYFLRR